MRSETFWKRRNTFLESQSAVGLRLQHRLQRLLQRSLQRAPQRKVWYDAYGINMTFDRSTSIIPTTNTIPGWVPHYLFLEVAVMDIGGSGPTLTVNFTDKDCDNPFGSVELLLPLKRVTTRPGAVCVIVDADETSRRLREAMIAFEPAFGAS